MRKYIYPVLVLILSLLLCACTTDIYVEIGNKALSTGGISTTEPTVDGDATDYDVEKPKPTSPLHSKLYMPEYSPQQIFEYFEEIVLHTEYATGTGNSSLVQKWNEPLRYRIYGNPTEDDLAVLMDLFAQLNEIAGFPGIYAANDEELENLTISFLEPESFISFFSEFVNGEDAYGATRFWYYTATNEIYTAKVGYRTDTDQTTRMSILIEEIINMLGLSDTVLREDSIVYQYSNSNTALSDVDWIILKMLYDPAIQCGMDADNCSAVIQELYF